MNSHNRSLKRFDAESFKTLKAYTYIQDQSNSTGKKSSEAVSIQNAIMFFLVELYRAYPGTYVSVRTIADFLNAAGYVYHADHVKSTSRLIINEVLDYVGIEENSNNLKTNVVYLTESFINELLKSTDESVQINTSKSTKFNAKSTTGLIDLTEVRKFYDLVESRPKLADRQLYFANIDNLRNVETTLEVKYKKNKFIQSFLIWLELISLDEKPTTRKVSAHIKIGETSANVTTIAKHFANFFRRDKRIKSNQNQNTEENSKNKKVRLPNKKKDLENFNWKALFDASIPDQEQEEKIQVIKALIQAARPLFEKNPQENNNSIVTSTTTTQIAQQSQTITSDSASENESDPAMILTSMSKTRQTLFPARNDADYQGADSLALLGGLKRPAPSASDNEKTDNEEETRNQTKKAKC